MQILLKPFILCVVFTWAYGCIRCMTYKRHLKFNIHSCEIYPKFTAIYSVCLYEHSHFFWRVCDFPIEIFRRKCHHGEHTTATAAKITANKL